MFHTFSCKIVNVLNFFIVNPVRPRIDLHVLFTYRYIETEYSLFLLYSLMDSAQPLKENFFLKESIGVHVSVIKLENTRKVKF